VIVQLAPDEDHGAGRRHKTGLIDAVAFFFFVDHRADIEGQILVGGPIAEQEAKVMVLLTEKAGAELAVGGNAYARTEAEKG